MTRLGALLLTAAMLAAAGPPLARAHDVRVFIGGGTIPRFHRPEHRISSSPRTHVIPGTVFVVPPSYHRCFIPGYWTHQWIPQVYSYNVWAPGRWSPEGTWIEGHYVPQTQSTGYWHPIWIPDRYC